MCIVPVLFQFESVYWFLKIIKSSRCIYCSIWTSVDNSTSWW